MEYHYQWPEYLEPDLPEGSGWDSLHTDTPMKPIHMPRFFPRGRVMRRRRIFPPPFNHYVRSVRPQWSTPIYDCGFQWNREPVPELCSSSPSRCCDNDLQNERSSTEKSSRSPARNTRKTRGSSRKPKSIRVHDDHSYPGSNQPHWTENMQYRECVDQSKELQMAHPSLLEPWSPSSAPNNGNSIYSPGPIFQYRPDFSCGASSPNCCMQSRARDISQNSSEMLSKTGHQEFCSNSEKEDRLDSIMRATIYETVDEPTLRACQSMPLEGEYHNYNLNVPADQEFSQPCQTEVLPYGEPPRSCQDGLSAVRQPCDSYKSLSQDSSKCQLSVYDATANIPPNFEQETALAVCSIQEIIAAPPLPEFLNSPSSQSATDTNQTKSESEVSCTETNNKSSVECDFLNSTQTTRDRTPGISDVKADVRDSSNILDQYSLNNNQHLASVSEDQSISSLKQENQLLTDLLSQLISGNDECPKYLLIDGHRLEEQKQPKCTDLVRLLEPIAIERALPESTENGKATNQSLALPPAGGDCLAEAYPVQEEESTSSLANTDSEYLHLMNISSALSETKQRVDVPAVKKHAPSNHLPAYEPGASGIHEIFPSNIDLPSSDSDSNHIETTLSSTTNYVLEEPGFTDALISIFDDSCTSEWLSTCVQPDSVLNVKEPKKRYKKVVKNIKLKTETRRYRKRSSSGKNTRNKNPETTQACVVGSCETKEYNLDYESHFPPRLSCNAQTHAKTDFQNYLSVNGLKVCSSDVRDAETQCEDTASKEESGFLGEVTRDKHFGPKTFCRSRRHMSEPEIAEKKQNDEWAIDIVSKKASSSPPGTPHQDKKTKAKRCDSTRVGNSMVNIKMGNSYYKRDKNINIKDSSARLPSTIESLAVSYEDSYEAQLAAKSKEKNVRNKDDSSSVYGKNFKHSVNRGCQVSKKMKTAPKKKTAANQSEAPEGNATHTGTVETKMDYSCHEADKKAKIKKPSVLLLSQSLVTIEEISGSNGDSNGVQLPARSDRVIKNKDLSSSVAGRHIASSATGEQHVNEENKTTLGVSPGSDGTDAPPSSRTNQNGFDRVLRKRKALNYSEPKQKRIRLHSWKPESELGGSETVVPENIDKNPTTKDREEIILTRSSKCTRNRFLTGKIKKKQKSSCKSGRLTIT